MDDDLIIRTAEASDTRSIVDLLSQDSLGAQRERPDALTLYEAALREISSDSNQELVVGELEGEVVACLQLSMLRHMTYAGGIRAQLEGVRVREELRNRGVGSELLRWAIRRAREKGCHIVQLTTDSSRDDALRFYQRLGFKHSHHGLKLHLP